MWKLHNYAVACASANAYDSHDHGCEAGAGAGSSIEECGVVICKSVWLYRGVELKKKRASRGEITAPPTVSVKKTGGKFAVSVGRDRDSKEREQHQDRQYTSIYLRKYGFFWIKWWLVACNRIKLLFCFTFSLLSLRFLMFWAHYSRSR